MFSTSRLLEKLAQVTVGRYVEDGDDAKRSPLASVNFNANRSPSPLASALHNAPARKVSTPKATWQEKMRQRSGGNKALEAKWKAQYAARQAAKKGGAQTAQSAPASSGSKSRTPELWGPGPNLQAMAAKKKANEMTQRMSRR